MTEWKSDYQRLYGAPLTRPEQAQALLRFPDRQWKKGRSAFEAAHSWIGNGNHRGVGIPQRVRQVLSEAPEWAEASVVTGFFEHATPLDTQSGPSNTDILVVCGLEDELGIAAVEAKAGETFGELVRDWRALSPSPGKEARWTWACDFFAVHPQECETLRWQLFHRTASAIIEAKRFRARHAVMLVHDFCADDSSVDDYRKFANAIRMNGAEMNKISDAKIIQGVSLRLARVKDTPVP